MKHARMHSVIAAFVFFSSAVVCRLAGGNYSFRLVAKKRKIYNVVYTMRNNAQTIIDSSSNGNLRWYDPMVLDTILKRQCNQKIA